MRELIAFGWKTFLFLILLSSGLARAEECPEWATPDRPILEHTFDYWSSHEQDFVGRGPRLDTPSYFWKAGVWFEMPYGYKSPWSIFPPQDPSSIEEYIEGLSRNSSRTGYDADQGEFNLNKLEDGSLNRPYGTFSFWMPSLRYVEHDMDWGASFRPCEAGRELSEETDYVVKIRIIWPGANGLQDTGITNPYLNSRIAQTFYYDDNNLLSGEVVVFSSCSNQSICKVEAWIREKDLILFLVFPKRAEKPGPDGLWRETLEATVTLIESWKLERTPLND